ncbi:response regulator [Neorhizobium sp. P12A]|uniref:response regulator n=1 Tax=Neorhizobium sp. P12A TaxID=2268027 RepID=UPI0011EBB090|nr:response regulator [Neorhizobium sp. P12A]KAA0693737.1 response regulator [Neorhizobium sp. P12A]
MDDDRNEWIAARAYALWEQAGRPFFEDRTHWEQAVLERDLLEQTRASADGRDVMNYVHSVRERRGATARVLIVEDEDRLRFHTVDFLEQAGHRVMEAANADEALVLLKRNDIDALVTDIDMPGTMDGLGLVRTVRSHWPAIKIVVTSGVIKLSHADLESGVCFISKPTPKLELLRMIS